MEHHASPSPAPSYPGGHPRATNMYADPNNHHLSPPPSMSRYSSPMYDMRHGSPESYPSSVAYSPAYGQQQQASAYEPLPDDVRPGHGHHYITPASSPPTPTPSQHSAFRNLRSGAVPRRNNGGQVMKGVQAGRVGKAPPKKKKPASAAAAAKTIDDVSQLETPLSQMRGKDMDSVEVADIAAWVNRSVEQRRDEVANGKIPGKIKRPMNAFMLYRKAYQNRAKQWCLHNNHQVVSRVCGQSWPLEPKPVRLQFNEWAALERMNHQRAHPDYKFTPAKPKKRYVEREDESDRGGDDDDARDLDDFEWASNRASSANRSRTHTPMGGEPDSDYRPPRSLAYQYQPRQSHLSAGAHQQVMYTQSPLQSYEQQQQQPMVNQYQYYQQQQHQGYQQPTLQQQHQQQQPPPQPPMFAEDPLSPSVAFDGLPGGDPLGMHYAAGSAPQQQQIDPSLAPDGIGHLDPAFRIDDGTGADPTLAGDAEVKWYDDVNPYGAGLPDQISMLAGNSDKWQISTNEAQQDDWQTAQAEY